MNGPPGTPPAKLRKKGLSQLSLNQRVTLIVALGSMVAAVASAFVAYQTYVVSEAALKIASDTRDTKTALKSLADLVHQTSAQVSATSQQLPPITKQAAAAEDEARALKEQLGPVQREAAAAEAQVKVANGSLAASEAQLQLARDEQRPWISVELTPIKAAPGVVYFVVKVSNVGHSPAFNVDPLFLSYVEDRGTAPPFPIKMESDACDQVDNEILDLGNQVQILFPGQSATPASAFSQNIVTYSQEDVAGKSAPDGTIRTLRLWAYGCVGYRFSKSEPAHHTAFAAALLWKTKTSAGEALTTPEIPVNQAIDGASLLVEPLQSSFTRID
jgi:hypothetical protein